MGCVSSKEDINDIHPRVFTVYNVGEEGETFSPGKMHITDAELIFYPRGKEPILWPLKCLRRYGFDAELFSFECGRRCHTGEGVYAFKCRRAEQLFNVLQECVQSAGHTPGDPPDGSGPTILRSATTSRPASDSELPATPALSSSSHPQSNGGVVVDAAAVGTHPAGRAAAATAAAQAIYVNDGDDDAAPASPKSAASSPPHAHDYVNTPPVFVGLPAATTTERADSQTSRPGSQVSTGSHGNGYAREKLGSAVNGASETSAAAEGYAMIDFDKTVALSNSANPSLQNDDGSSRKTRHNSTIAPTAAALQ
ncbi:PREDICTED: fibroblast growth factor receptor substrate 3-like [Priapulus caudatus]|uniref:Fibroblast growth factor receptor substrate 3-like n=1 Tax=Priapulus caudatus TaxID=37621 RepID=A0ABM1EX94_PRICU|nr:PREDICTED: fibroblast growth factor receptor substrate 3-like [Priapulus caudatus]